MLRLPRQHPYTHIAHGWSICPCSVNALCPPLSAADLVASVCVAPSLSRMPTLPALCLLYGSRHVAHSGPTSGLGPYYKLDLSARVLSSPHGAAAEASMRTPFPRLISGALSSDSSKDCRSSGEPKSCSCRRRRVQWGAWARPVAPMAASMATARPHRWAASRPVGPYPRGNKRAFQGADWKAGRAQREQAGHAQIAISWCARQKASSTAAITTIGSPKTT